MKRLALFLLLTSSPALAHDMWLEPQQDGSFAIHQGERLVPTADAPALFGERVSRWEVIGGVAAMERHPSYVELEAGEFNHYLDEEGHSHIEKVVGGSVVERFTRHLKLIVDANADAARVFGLRLEIVPLSRPRVGSLSVRVLLEGKPLPEARFGLVRRGDATERVARTDSNGEATLTLSEPGFYLIRATHLHRCDCDDADFESLWAALTFEVSDETPSPTASSARTSKAAPPP